ncbi:DUF542 domain-containing protein [Mogibacterium diversum]|uniref:DUF542 domain-containing protein n=1 Tax=Mogibacterium diversum TaxID=114527 RepID=UPI0028D64E56|nr:DUF542 domain-containing protein [Mogibacterium diversum]
MITEKMTLAEVVRLYPQTIPYLNELHLDYCCGGHLPMDESFPDGEVDVQKIVAELNKLAAKPAPSQDGGAASIEAFKRLSVNDMLADLEVTHHRVEREMMTQLDQLINKILVVHYTHHAEELTKIHNLFAAMKAELEVHFAKEERLVFPLMRANPHPDNETLAFIKQLEDEHNAVGDMIKEMQRLTNDYTVPQDACVTYERTFNLIREFTEDVFVHVFKENSIVFPEYEEQA